MIFDTKLGHFYHGLSSVFNLKAWPEAGIAGLLIRVLLGPREQAPMCPSRLIYATMCEDSTITHDLYPQRREDIGVHRHLPPVWQHLYSALRFLLGLPRPCLSVSIMKTIFHIFFFSTCHTGCFFFFPFQEITPW